MCSRRRTAFAQRLCAIGTLESNNGASNDPLCAAPSTPATHSLFFLFFFFFPSSPRDPVQQRAKCFAGKENSDKGTFPALVVITCASCAWAQPAWAFFSSSFFFPRRFCTFSHFELIILMTPFSFRFGMFFLPFLFFICSRLRGLQEAPHRRDSDVAPSYLRSFASFSLIFLVWHAGCVPRRECFGTLARTVREDTKERYALPRRAHLSRPSSCAYTSSWSVPLFSG